MAETVKREETAWTGQIPGCGGCKILVDGARPLANREQDLEQVEEWNEHGELKDQIEDVEDIFGDMPVSGSVAEAQAAAAQREAQQAAAKGDKPPAPIRQASETRHISISEPKRDKSPASLLGKDTTVAMAMKQAGAEAAAKAGQKKTTAGTATTDSSSSNAPTSISSEIKREPDMEDHNTANTEAKTPALLAEEGAMKMTIEKLQSGNEADSTFVFPRQNQ